METHRRNLVVPFIATLILLGISFVLKSPKMFFSCEENVRFFCKTNFILGFSQPLYAFLPFILIAILLNLFSPVVTNKWKKFTYWYLPIVTILIAMTDIYGQDFSPIPGRALFASWLGYLYLIISTILILRSLYKNYMKS